MFGSPWPSLRPYAPKSVADLIGATVRRLPDKPALIGTDGASCTFAEFWSSARSMAAALQHEGVARGDVVAIFAPNSIEYAVVLHGAMLAGATVTTLNPLYREREVEGQLRDTGATVVFAAKSLAGIVDAVRPRLPHQLRVHTIEETGEFILGDERRLSPIRPNPETDLALLPYSSGTTGLPKGVMLTHQNVTANMRQILALQMTTEQATGLSFLPFYHIYGMMILNCGLAVGLTQVLLPRFDPEAVFSLIDRHRVTDLYCVPPALLAMVNARGLERYDCSSLRLITSAAAPLPAEIARQAAALFGCGVTQGYGMTECSSLTNVSPASDLRDDSVGPPIADTIERVVGIETGADLPSGEAGELLVRGPQVMLGYWRNPGATADAITRDGWLRTGDIVCVDNSGCVRILDRKKEMIKVKGHQVMPAELEAVLMEHPAVRDAAVIPKQDREAGEVPKAFVVLRGPADLTELESFVAGRLAPYKRVRYVESVDAIPRALSGKILRRQLIERERERDRASANEASGDGY